jgi:hypothetical protein
MAYSSLGFRSPGPDSPRGIEELKKVIGPKRGETMKRSNGLVIGGIVILAIGAILGFGFHYGSVASAQEGLLVDGQVQAEVDDSNSEQVTNPPVTMAGAVSYLTLASYEFQPTHSDLTFASYGPAIYALNIPAGGYSFKAPVSLPNGASVTNIKIFLVDNSADSNMYIQFYRIRMSNSTQTELDWVSTVGLPPSTAVQTVAMTGAPISIIDNIQYAYSIRYQPVITGSEHQIVAAQIQYQLPVAAYMPLVGK